MVIFRVKFRFMVKIKVVFMGMVRFRVMVR